MKRQVLVFLFILAAQLLQAARLPETIIRVGLLQNVNSFHLSSENPYYIYELSAGEKTSILPDKDYLVRVEGKVIEINGMQFMLPARIASEKNGDIIKINGRRYKDNINVIYSGPGVNVINEIGIEDYLCGILPREVDKGWGDEALKAQAVISRTYALRNMRKHDKHSFDLCTQTHCQVYGGMESEQESTSKAVSDTRAEVLAYNGILAQSLFHASCGGKTENPAYVWNLDGDTPAYLMGRRDRYCAASPHHEWKGFVSKEQIKNRLMKNDILLGNIKGISASGQTPSGRARYLVLSHSNGTFKMPAARFRLFVDTWQIKSTMITSIVRKNDGFEFSGSGWGHGVGMCQWGAKVMADKGFNYKEILEFYYPGAKVEKWEE